MSNGIKHDSMKQDWYAMPLEVLEGLAQVFEAGAKKYEIFNCLKPFENGDRRFWSAMMRHLKACQRDPLAVDPETGCYHGDEACWNILMRTYHAKKNRMEGFVNGIERPDYELPAQQHSCDCGGGCNVPVCDCKDGSAEEHLGYSVSGGILIPNNQTDTGSK